MGFYPIPKRNRNMTNLGMPVSVLADFPAVTPEDFVHKTPETIRGMKLIMEMFSINILEDGRETVQAPSQAEPRMEKTFVLI